MLPHFEKFILVLIVQNVEQQRRTEFSELFHLGTSEFSLRCALGLSASSFVLIAT